jgi:hypothetical protein
MGLRCADYIKESSKGKVIRLIKTSGKLGQEHRFHVSCAIYGGKGGRQRDADHSGKETALKSVCGRLSLRGRRRLRAVQGLLVMAGTAGRGGHRDEKQEGNHNRSDHRLFLLCLTFEQ